jgi:glycosyltransferase involved in cell wall biosynthesis
VVLLIRRLGFGGAERQLVNLANGLSDMGHQILIATYYASGELERYCTGQNLRLVCLEKRGRWDLLGYTNRLGRAINNFQPDVVYSFSSSTNLLSYFLRFRLNVKPVLVWRIATSFIDYSKYDWSARLVVVAERLISRRITHVISNSFAGAEFAVSKGFDRKSIEVIPNGIYAPNVLSERSNYSKARVLLGLPIKGLLIGLVGRIDYMKGHSLLLDAVADLASRGIFGQVVFVGNGDPNLKQALQRKIKKLKLENVVYWLPALNEIGRIYEVLDLLVCPSRGEGFPNVLAEGMAHGKIVVASDVGDNRLIIENKCFIFPDADVSALAKTLEYSINLSQTEKAFWQAQGVAKIKENYSVQRYIERTESYFFRILA